MALGAYDYGGPFYWKWETSVLPAAVRAYLDPSAAFTPEHLMLVRNYLIHWIEAPCWMWNDAAWKPRQQWVSRVLRAEDRAAISAVLYDLLAIGIDPL